MLAITVSATPNIKKIIALLNTVLLTTFSRISLLKKPKSLKQYDPIAEVRLHKLLYSLSHISYLILYPLTIFRKN